MNVLCVCQLSPLNGALAVKKITKKAPLKRGNYLTQIFKTMQNYKNFIEKPKSLNDQIEDEAEQRMVDDMIRRDLEDDYDYDHEDDDDDFPGMSYYPNMEDLY